MARASADAFGVIVSAEDVRAGKPVPEGFLCALERLRRVRADLTPADCLVVEDSLAGVEAARRAGMRCLALTNSHPRQMLTGADLVLPSLEGVGWEVLEALFAGGGAAS